MPRESTGMITARKDWPILMLVEKSDETRTMLSINNMVKRFMQEIVNIQDVSPNCSIKVGTYTFGNSSQFVHPDRLVPISEYEISEVFKNDVVDLTSIVSQLNNDLSRKTLLMDVFMDMEPNIILTAQSFMLVSLRMMNIAVRARCILMKMSTSKVCFLMGN